MRDSKPALHEIFSEQNTHKEPTTPGMLLQLDLSRTFVEAVGEPTVLSCLQQIESILNKLSKNSNLSLEDDISTTREDHLRLTVTVTYSEPKMIPEKNGLLSLGEQ